MNARAFVKRFLPKTLLGRSLLIIVSPLILLQVVSAYIFYDRHWDTITWRLASSVAGDIANVMQQLRREPEAAARIFEDAGRSMELRLTLEPGEILPNREQQADYGFIDGLLAKALDERVKRPYRIDSSQFDERVVIDVQMADAVLTAVVPGSRLFSSTTYIFIMWMVGTSLILFAVASVFMRNQVRPLRRLARAADSFGKGREVDEQHKLEGSLEVRQAATAFNIMAERIRRQLRQRTDMLSGVSHDLRTPLTRMRLQLAMLGENPEITELKANVLEMEKMIDGYLTFARGEGGERSVEADLSELVQDVTQKWKAGGVSVDCHVEGRIVAWVKPNALRRCVDNLVANACRYGKTVWVRAGKRGDSIEITIDDDGPGIPADQREDAFRPFYRLDRSRNPETGGTGLGLSISLDVARVHGGDLMLEDSPHGGLRARIRLPI